MEDKEFLKRLRKQHEAAREEEAGAVERLKAVARNYNGDDAGATDLDLVGAASAYVSAYDWRMWCLEQLELGMLDG